MKEERLLNEKVFLHISSLRMRAKLLVLFSAENYLKFQSLFMALCLSLTSKLVSHVLKLGLPHTKPQLMLVMLWPLSSLPTSRLPSQSREFQTKAG